MNCLPAFYFPTTVLYVDDDQLMLDAYKQLFIEMNYKYKFLKKVSEVESYMKSYSSKLHHLNMLELNDDFESNQTSVAGSMHLNIEKMFELIASQDKYDEISLFMSDYYLNDSIDGLELCKLYKDQYFKRMLLTVSDNYNLARQALNVRAIDYFANKTDSVEQIKEAIFSLSINFFCDLTLELRQYTEVNGESPLLDDVFIRYFNGLLKTHDITEYYLIDKNGSYFMIDSLGKRYVLIVHNAYSFFEILNILNEYPNLEPVLDSIKNKGLISFFGINKSISDIDINSLENYLFPGLLLPGKQQYFVNFMEYDSSKF